MIHFAESAKQLREALDHYIEAWGDAPLVHPDASGQLDDLLQAEWVYVDAELREVGTEAEDYVPKEGERKALKIS